MVVNVEGGLYPQLGAGQLGQRAEGFHAAGGGRGDQPGAGAEAREQLGQGLGVGAAGVVERTAVVGPFQCDLATALACLSKITGTVWGGSRAKSATTALSRL